MKIKRTQSVGKENFKLPRLRFRFANRQTGTIEKYARIKAYFSIKQVGRALRLEIRRIALCDFYGRRDIADF